VIGTFVLGLGDQLQDTSPQASFGFSTTTETVDGNDATGVSVTHETGDSIASNNLNILVNGAQAYTVSGTNDVAPTFTSEVTAGSSVTIVAATNNDAVDPSNTNNTYVNDGTTLDIDADGTTVSDVGLESGDTVRVVWSSDSGGSSATLGSFELP